MMPFMASCLHGFVAFWLLYGFFVGVFNGFRWKGAHGGEFKLRQIAAHTGRRRSRFANLAGP